MSQSKFAPLTEESRRLRSQLGYVSSQYGPDSEEVQAVRRQFNIERLIDLARAHAPYIDGEYARVIEALKGEE